MEKYIFDESNGLWYELQGDYYIPCFTLQEVETKEIGVWGMRHLDYLKSCRKVTYNRLQTEGKLNSHLYNINAQAQEMFDNLIVQYKKSEGITEELKATDQMEWVRRMNNIKQRVTEIVNNEQYIKKPRFSFVVKVKAERSPSPPYIFMLKYQF